MVDASVDLHVLTFALVNVLVTLEKLLHIYLDTIFHTFDHGDLGLLMEVQPRVSPGIVIVWPLMVMLSAKSWLVSNSQ